eukprot:4395201-Pleurochrysis_carterae.AAC.1
MKNGHVVDFEATPSQSEAEAGPAGTPIPKLRRQLPQLLAEILYGIYEIPHVLSPFLAFNRGACLPNIT